MTNEIFDLQGDALRDYSIKSKLLREYISDSNPTDNDPNIVIYIRDTSEFLAMGQSWVMISGLTMISFIWHFVLQFGTFFKFGIFEN